MVAVAARPLEKARPCAPPSSAARHASRAWRVGFPLREYSKPLWLPGPSCANVLARTIGVITAPLSGSGGWPAWTARVSIPRVLEEASGRILGFVLLALSAPVYRFSPSATARSRAE